MIPWEELKSGSAPNATVQIVIKMIPWEELKLARLDLYELPSFENC